MRADLQKQNKQIMQDLKDEIWLRLDRSDQKVLLLEKETETVLKKQDAMQEQSKYRLDSSKTCSTSQADHGIAADGSCSSPATP